MQTANGFVRPRLHKAIQAVQSLMFSMDMGNGELRAFSSEFYEIVRVAPVVAPVTSKRDTITDSGNPLYSLRDNKTGQVEVFGVDDIGKHGKRALTRRLSGPDRYTDPDYHKMFKMLLYQCFKNHVGEVKPIKPSGIISLPVSIYNDTNQSDQITDALCGEFEISDYSGRSLKVIIDPKRLLLVPEGYGAMQHFAYDPSTLQRRDDTDISGSTILLDIGYEIANQHLYEGMQYIRDSSFSLNRAGMGVIVRSIQSYANTKLRGIDVSYVDRGLREVAGVPLGDEKNVEVAAGSYMDVRSIYDPELENMVKRIADDVQTNFSGSVNRIALNGGSAFHMAELLRPYFDPIPVVMVPDADVANPLGAYTKLLREAIKRFNK